MESWPGDLTQINANFTNQYVFEETTTLEKETKKRLVAVRWLEGWVGGVAEAERKRRGSSESEPERGDGVVPDAASPVHAGSVR